MHESSSKGWMPREPRDMSRSSRDSGDPKEEKQQEKIGDGLSRNR